MTDKNKKQILSSLNNSFTSPSERQKIPPELYLSSSCILKKKKTQQKKCS